MKKIYDIDELMRYSYEKGLFSGAWLYKKNGVVVSRGAYGTLSPSDKSLIRTDTIFGIASITKQFTAAAIMLLCERGLLSLNDKLENYFPTIQYPGITIKNLMNHTSGLPDYVEWLSKTVIQNNRFANNSDMDVFLAQNDTPAQFAPGSNWAYCNTGYCVLGRLIEIVSGMSFKAFLHDNLFVPAGMTHTDVRCPFKENDYPENLARGSILESGHFVEASESHGEGSLTLLDGIEGDGAVMTTVEDMLLWDEALRQGNVLSHAAQKEMATVTLYQHDGKTLEYPYGFGWQINSNDIIGKWISHTGRWAGYNGIYARALEEDSMIIMLCNQYGCDILARMQLLDGVEQILSQGETMQPRTLDETYPDAIPVTVMDHLAGEYAAQSIPMVGLFGESMSLYKADTALMLRLTFMDQSYDTEILPTGNDRYIARDGLFELHITDDKIVTAMYGEEFVYCKER